MTNGRKIVLPVYAPLSDVLHILDLACFCKKKALIQQHRVISPVLLNCHCKELSIKTYKNALVLQIHYTQVALVEA